CIETLEKRQLLSFSPAAAYPVGPDPQAIASADFNGDGRLDLVSANAGGNSVSVLLGSGNGAFSAALDYGTGAYPRSVAAGDFNGDGNPDIVTANAGSVYAAYGGDLSVLAGNGDGTFQPAQSIALPNQHPAGFTEPQGVVQTPLAVAVGDMNADGTLDLAVSSRAYAAVLVGSGYYGNYYQYYDYGYTNVLLGNGSGAFAHASATEDGGLPLSIALADFNGDAKLDVVSGYNLSVKLGNGDGTLQAPISANGSRFNSDTVPVGDFDEDGNLDLLSSSGGVTVLKGRGDGTFETGPTIATGARAAVVGDVDADGNLDVVVTSSETQYGYCGYYGCSDPTTTEYATVLLGYGDGSFAVPLTSTLGSHPGYAGVSAAVLGDVDGDADPDLAATGSSGTVSVALNDGDWVAVPPPPVMSVSDATATEGAGTVTAVFTVSLDKASADTVMVQYGTAGGTAVSGNDFDAATGTLTFAPGETSKTISVAVRNDAIDEYDESFYVNLSGATNAQLVDSQGVGTVVDDDPPPALSIANASRIEGHRGSAPLTFTVSLSAASEKDVWVNFSTANGSATTANGDYVGTSGSVFIAAGQTSGTLSVMVVGDKRKESDETFLVNLSGAVNAVFADGQAIGTILNDDSGKGPNR
ncbi:MAG: VCBS repeat-containing protein, partial [Acidimicrobiia bacterium]|nr:VCBS repeat-containing protein [Acidimicrobiia bacterium]